MKCPRCGSEELSRSELRDAGYNEAYYDFVCDNCGCIGEEQYYMVHKNTMERKTP